MQVTVGGPAMASARAVAGAGVFALALGTAGAVGAMLPGTDGTARQLLVAFTCSAIAVPLIVWLRRRSGRSLAGLGLARHGALRSFGLGVLVTGGAAAVVLAAGTALGWLEWSPVDWATLAGFLIVNTVAALALEAVPEELTFRGYVLGVLTDRLHRWAALVCTTGLFLVAPAGANVVRWALGTLLGAPVPPPGFAPQGEDPVAYGILLAVFGGTLLVARVATGSLYACIALHLTFLTVNRVTLQGGSRDAGWSAEPTTPDALLLVPGYLLLTAAAFAVLARVRGRRGRDAEPGVPGTQPVG